MFTEGLNSSRGGGGGAGGMLPRKFLKLDIPNWPKLTFCHQKCNKCYELSPSFYLEELRFLAGKA